MSLNNMYYILLTTTTCHKCPEFKKYVNKHVTFNGVILDERSDLFAKIADKFNVMNAPTIIIFENNGDDICNLKELFRTSEISELQEFIEKK